MGKDAQIFFKIADGKSFDDLKGLTLFARITPLNPESKRSAALLGAQNATHEVINDYRFYGIGYERGPWPDICELLQRLLEFNDVEKVWYGSDYVEDITHSDLIDLCLHYMKNGSWDEALELETRREEELWTEYAKAALPAWMHNLFNELKEIKTKDKEDFIKSINLTYENITLCADTMLSAHKKRWGHE